MVKSYRKLMATTRAVLRDAATMVRRLGQRVRARPVRSVQPILQRAQDRLQAMRPLVQRVVEQTRARILGGDTHVPDKVLSLFEPHTETIRKGKIAKPNEFGKLVTIQEVGTSDHHRVRRAREATGRRHLVDRRRWIGIRRSSVARRISPPAIAASARRPTNRRRPTAASAAWCLPRRGPKSPARRAYERQRWFRRGTTVARRLRRPHQCAQTTTWTRPLSLPWRRRHASMGRVRRHRGQSDEHRDLLEGAGRRIEKSTK